MKKNLINSALLAIVALMGGVSTSCGSSEASDLLTDVPFCYLQS